MNFPVYEGVHEAIIAEEDWELAQEKRSKNNYRREKIHDPEHAHILSGILKCPCCGKGMYGNIAKAGRKDNKIRYLEKQLSVLNASLHQAETIKTRIEQQMDNLDVTDTHYDKKISDLQRRMNIWFPWKSYQHLRAWFYFAGKRSIIVFQFAIKWCRIKTTFHVY